MKMQIIHNKTQTISIQNKQVKKVDLQVLKDCCNFLRQAIQA